MKLHKNILTTGVWGF